MADDVFILWASRDLLLPSIPYPQTVLRPCGTVREVRARQLELGEVTFPFSTTEHPMAEFPVPTMRSQGR